MSPACGVICTAVRVVGAYLSSFSFGAFPNRLDQQLMVGIASLLLMAVETDAAMQKKNSKKEGERKDSLIELQKCVKIGSTLFIQLLTHFYFYISVILLFIIVV